MVRREGFGLPAYLAFAAATVFTLLVCVSLGSVKLPLRETFGLLWNALAGRGTGTGMSATIVFSVRLPRVLCVALTGASLSVCGAAMQGLLKNPLADGSTLGVSSGASLGAVISIAFGITLPGIPLAGTMSMAMLFAFLSLVVILGLAYRLDGSLSTGTIILIGVIYSMFVSSVLSLVITFAPDKVQSITFWTMGSLAGRGYVHVLVLLGALVVFGGVLFGCARELNAFAVGEDNARHIGVNVRRVKLHGDDRGVGAHRRVRIRRRHDRLCGSCDAAYGSPHYRAEPPAAAPGELVRRGDLPHAVRSSRAHAL